VWSGPLIKTVDSGSFVYDFRGAGKFLCIQSRIAADAKWYRYISDTFTPLDGFLENTSTVGGYVVDNDTAYTPGSTSMVVKLASSAQASTFTVGEWYFIYFAGNNQSGNPRVNITYGRVDAVGVAGGLDADQIRFSWLSDGESRDFIYYGSHISPYHHCWYTMVGPNFSPSGTYDNTSAFERLIIPYVSYNYDTNRYLAHDQSGSIYQTGAFALDSSVGRGKQDNNYYPLQAGLVYEVYKANYPAGQVVSSDGMNRVYGESDNVFMALGTDFTDMELGIDVNDEVVVSIGRSDLIGSGLSSSYHAFIPDTEST
jgi:hypothetical protein